jgi:hypothetical protein
MTNVPNQKLASSFQWRRFNISINIQGRHIYQSETESEGQGVYTASGRKLVLRTDERGREERGNLKNGLVSRLWMEGQTSFWLKYITHIIF